MSDPRPELVVLDAPAWRNWLVTHGRTSGIWLVLAKKGFVCPTSLRYDEALEEALCQGWIDGQTRRRDESTYLRRFTPRSPRSAWSRRNVELVEELTAAGRMQPAGTAAVAAAIDDGRWDAAYAGQATIEVPGDVREALDAAPRAQAMFEILTRQNRYAVLYRLGTTSVVTRHRRIEQFVAMLARGETLHPQRRKLTE